MNGWGSAHAHMGMIVGYGLPGAGSPLLRLPVGAKIIRHRLVTNLATPLEETYSHFWRISSD